MSYTRSLAFILITIVLVSFIISSCDTEEELHDHSFSDATCTSPKTCYCGETEGEPLSHTFVDGFCICGAAESDYLPSHVHSYDVLILDPTCTENGVAIYTCECGNTYDQVISAFGQSYTPVVTEPTCTDQGYTTYTCGCGDFYISDPVDVIEHSYTVSSVTDPTCTTGGYTTYSCQCGDSYNSDEVGTVDHIDVDIDAICDFEGCSAIVVPMEDSKLTIGVANRLSAVAPDLNYYVEGVVTEIIDNDTGIFVICDEAGDSILIRLPKHESGAAYYTWKTGKVTLGDTVSVYGKVASNMSDPMEQTAKIGGGVLKVLQHEHKFVQTSPAKNPVCDCGAEDAPAEQMD